MGAVLIMLGDVDSGASFLSRGIALDPNYLDAYIAFATGLPSTPSATEIYVIYATVFATAGNVEKTGEYLTKAKKVGFQDWRALGHSKEFERIRHEPRIQEFFRP